MKNQLAHLNVPRLAPSSAPSSVPRTESNLVPYPVLRLAPSSNDLTCFEPESKMMLVGGLAFHKYYFDLTSHTDNSVVSNHITMSHPHVRWIGVNSSAVIVGYTRVNLMFVDGKPITKIIPETRIW